MPGRKSPFAVGRKAPSGQSTSGGAKPYKIGYAYECKVRKLLRESTKQWDVHRSHASVFPDLKCFKHIPGTFNSFECIAVEVEIRGTMTKKKNARALAWWVDTSIPLYLAFKSDHRKWTRDKFGSGVVLMKRLYPEYPEEVNVNDKIFRLG